MQLRSLENSTPICPLHINSQRRGMGNQADLGTNTLMVNCLYKLFPGKASDIS